MARRYDKAIPLLERSLEVDPGPIPEGRAGRTTDALATLQRLERLRAAGATSRRILSLDLARVHAALGQRDRAFRRLEEAYKEHDLDLVFLRVDPQWDSLRADPRFVDLVRDVGIPWRQ
jgi:tetratricopeptide (TPR) repeat protein